MEGNYQIIVDGKVGNQYILRFVYADSYEEARDLQEEYLEDYGGLVEVTINELF